VITDQQIEAAVQQAYGHYRAEAVKRGRDPRFPYVPIYRFSDGAGNSQTTQIRNRAYSTRGEAIQCAADFIARLKQHMRDQLCKPGCRALREQYGLPREIA